MSNSFRIRDLLQRYTVGKLSSSEEEELLNLLNDASETELVNQNLVGLIQEKEQFALEAAADNESRVLNILAIDKAILIEDREPSRIPVYKRTWMWLAASILILMGTGIYVWSSKSRTTVSHSVAATGDIGPGKTGAILTLSDGRQILLDSVGNGVVASQKGAVVFVENGGLVYAPKNAPIAEAEFNVMSTPKGRQFQLVLPDGTKVWLNAASSLRYPTVFTGKERLVEVSGEVYFEVSKDAEKPFKVKINNTTTVEVLGTSFNINSYSNEDAIRTTLIDGSIRINTEKKSQVLKKGQQAVVGSAQDWNVVDNADIGKVLAWKNGFFNFSGMRFSEVMKQLERWYDIEVVYLGGVPNIGFYGKLDRNVSLLAILDGLKESGIRFKIESGKLIIMP